MEEFTRGLYVTFIGMALVFMSMSFIMLSIWGMKRIFRQKDEGGEGEAKVANDAPPADEVEGEEDVIAAIAVALALAMEGEKPDSARERIAVTALSEGPTLWSASGRLAQMNSRNVTREIRRR